MTGTHIYARRVPGSGGRERGIALIMAMVVLLVLSAMAAGIMFSTQTEIWASSGYKGAEQARYIAEAGAQRAADWLQNTYGTTSAVSTDLANGSQYNLAKYPVQYVPGSNCSGNPVGFTTNTNVACLSYYDSTNSLNCTTGSTCFNTAVALPADFNLPKAKVDVAAQLVQAQQVGNNWNLTWKIDSRGSVGVVKPATAQVTEIYFQTLTASSSSTAPPFKYGVFATGTGCGAISFSGGQYTESYNSQASGNVGNHNPAVSQSGGDVATFGNISLLAGAYIYGNVYAPGYSLINSSAPVAQQQPGFSGGGPWPYYNASQACSATTKYAVNEDNSGSAVICGTNCKDEAYNLPSNVTSSYYATPVMPSGVPTNTQACSSSLYNGLCNGGSGGGAGPAYTIPPSSLLNGSAGGGQANFGQVTFGSSAVITLQSGTYNMDTLNVVAGAQVIPSGGPVVINVFNASNSSMPVNFNGGTGTNYGGDPGNLAIVYAGNKTVNITAGAVTFATIYAPNAPITISGGAGIYGGVVGNTVTFSGSGHVVYDTHLGLESTNISIGNSNPPTGPVHLDQFSWTMNYTPQE